MIALTYLFVAAVLTAGLLTSISIWAPRRLGLKVMALATAMAFLPLSYASMADLLSKPKPIDLEWWLSRSPEATVLGSSMREGEGIYLWLQLEQAREPRAYVLPWDQSLAEQLQTALREAEEQEGELHMRLPFEPSLDDREPKFYALPQPALPPKDAIDPPDYVEQHHAQNDI